MLPLVAETNSSEVEAEEDEPRLKLLSVLVKLLSEALSKASLPRLAPVELRSFRLSARYPLPVDLLLLPLSNEVSESLELRLLELLLEPRELLLDPLSDEVSEPFEPYSSLPARFGLRRGV